MDREADRKLVERMGSENSTKSSWRAVTRGKPHGLILGPTLLNIFNNDPAGGTERTLGTFAGDPELGGEADAPDGRAAVEGDLDGLEKPHETQQREISDSAR